MQLAQVQEHATRILDEVERAVVGKREALELVLLGRLRRSLPEHTTSPVDAALASRPRPVIRSPSSRRSSARSRSG